MAAIESDVRAAKLVKAGEVSTAGRRSVGSIWGLWPEPYDPEGITLTTYDTMRRTDETVKAGLQFLKLSCISKMGEYQHEDPKIKEFVDTAISLMRGTLERTMSELLSALWAGFACAELVYALVPSGPWAGKVYYDKIRVLHPLSVHPKGIEADEHGNVKAIVQFAGQGVEERRLEERKFLHWTYAGGGETFGTIWGTSMLRSAHRWWFAKDLGQKLWGIYLERFSIPLALGFFPPDEVLCPVHGTTEPGPTAGLHMLQAWNTKTEMAFTALRDTAGGFVKDVPRIELLSPEKGGSGDPFDVFIRTADVRIFRALLTPSLVFQEAEFGTRAQAAVHLDAFFVILEDLQREICDLLVEQVIRPLLDLNFANLDNYGQWVPEPLTAEDMTKLADMLFKLTQAGYFQPTDPPTQEWVRSKFAPDLEIEEAVPPEEGVPEAMARLGRILTSRAEIEGGA